MRPRAISIILVGLVLILGSTVINEFLPEWRWAHHPFHAVIEGLGAFIAVVVATMILSLLHYDRLSPTYAWVASALAGMGILDGFHAGTHAGQEFVWLHSIATLVGGVFFALVWLPDKITESLRAKTLPLFVGVAATVFALLSLIFPDALPVMTTEAGFTLTARFANILGGLCFLAASSFFFFRDRGQVTKENIILSNHCFLFGISGIIFEFSVLWDGSWWLWHSLRLISYLIVLYYFFFLFNFTQATIVRETKALKESEARFKDIAEAASDWFWEMGPDLRFTYHSDRYFEITGFRPEDKVGTTRTRYVDPSDHAVGAETWDAHTADLEARRPFKDFEYSFKVPDGSVLHARTSGIPVFDPDGAFLGYRGTGTDITKRKQAEKALRESEERFRSVIDNSPSIITLKDTDGRIQLVNRKHKEMFSIESSDIVGKSSFDLYPEKLAEEATAHDRKVLETKSAITEERRLYIKQGTRDFLITKFPILDGSGDVVRIGTIGTDITEHKQAEEELARQKTILEATLEHLDQGITMFDEDLKLIVRNKRALEVLGLPEEFAHAEASLEDWLRYNAKRGEYGPGDVEEQVREHMDLARKFEPHNFERIRPDGTVLEIHGKPVPGHGFVSSYTDITERKQAEETLDKKTRLMELLQRVAASANEAGSVDEAMKTGLDEVCAHTGWPVGHVYRLADDGTGELVPTKIWHLDRPEDFKAFRRVTEKTRFAPGVGLPGRVLTSGLPAWIADVTKDPNFPRAKLAKNIGVKGGFAFPVLVGRENVVAVLEFFAAEAVEPDRAILEVMGPIGTQLGRVVERSQAEVALRESERRFRDIAESASDWFWEMDKDLRFTYHSPRYFEITGFRPEDKIGATRTRFVDPSSREAETEKWDAHMADLEAHRPFKDFEYSFKAPDGSIRHVRNSGIPVFDPDGAFLGYRGTGTNVTGQRKVESQLQQAQKMEAVGNLTGGIAHDFNNILGIVLGNLQLLKRRLKDGDRFRSLIEAAIDATQRGADLTGRLLAFSRRQELDPRVLDMNELVAGMDKILRRTLGEQVEIKTTLADGLGRVKADPAQLESAILNLTLNARDAMARGGGGRLMIETSNAELDIAYITMHPYAKAGPHVCLSVADTGPGIPEEIRERIFEPFFTTKEVGKGSGLGLSMIYGFVKQSGGHINVYSEDGHGARFRIYLPRTDEPSAALETGEAADDRPGGTETVLLVEDDEQFRTTAALLLEDLGYTVLGEPDGPSALKSLEAHPEVDVLFTDMVMPGGLNGHEVAERAQELQPGLPVLLTSGYPRDAFSEGRRFTLLSKPYTDVSLAQTLRAVLDGRHKPEE